MIPNAHKNVLLLTNDRFDFLEFKLLRKSLFDLKLRLQINPKLRLNSVCIAVFCMGDKEDDVCIWCAHRREENNYIVDKNTYIYIPIIWKKEHISISFFLNFHRNVHKSFRQNPKFVFEKQFLFILSIFVFACVAKALN